MSISVRLNGERVVLLGWARAILLQLAHPLIAAGVADHSTFRGSALAPAVRLHQTVRAMLSLTFGTEADRAATLAGINAIHRRVNGVLREAAGRFPAGTPYSAEDPDLLVWVHATLVESTVLTYANLVAPLGVAERDQYCREAASVAHALGAGGNVPDTWSGLEAYTAAKYRSGDIVVSPIARELAGAVLAPTFAWALGPAAHVNRLFTVGWLPPSVVEQYGFEWTEKDARALRRWTAAIRGVRRRLPDALARF